MAEIRDNRKPGWFWISNEILDEYSAELEPYGIAVYNALARRANEKGQCWPGKEDIARLTGMSIAQVKRALKKLERLGLITIERRPRAGNKWETNLYTLLAVRGRVQQTLGSTSTQGVGSHRPQVGSTRPTNNTHEQHPSITTHNNDVCAVSETSLPPDLTEQLQAMRFRNQKAERQLTAMYADCPDRAYALVAWAQREAKNPAAWLSKAILEGWEPPTEAPQRQAPDPNCPVCHGLGRVLDANGQWSEPCTCTLSHQPEEIP